jgi:hypothetical protein
MPFPDAKLEFQYEDLLSLFESRRACQVFSCGGESTALNLRVGYLKLDSQRNH